MKILEPIIYFFGAFIGIGFIGFAIKWFFYCGTVGICEGRKKSLKGASRNGEEGSRKGNEEKFERRQA